MKDILPTRGFTLIEILVAMSIGVALMGAVAWLFVVTGRLVFKNQEIDAAVTTTRQVQDKLYSELSTAISLSPKTLADGKILQIRPEYTDADPSSTTAPRYATVTYRVPIGSYATVKTTAPSNSSDITLIWPDDERPKTGDFLFMDEPDLEKGILINSVNYDTSGTLIVGLAQTLNQGSSDKDKGRDALTGKLVRIQRERRFATVSPATVTGLTPNSPFTQLHWYESTANAQPTQILSKNVDTQLRYLFAREPEDTSNTLRATNPSVSWQFNFKSTESKTRRLLGGDNVDFHQTSFANGLIMPKSGDPLEMGGGPEIEPPPVYKDEDSEPNVRVPRKPRQRVIITSDDFDGL